MPTLDSAMKALKETGNGSMEPAHLIQTGILVSRAIRMVLSTMQCIELIKVSCVAFDLCFLGCIGCFPFTNVAALFICIAVCQVVPLYRPHSHTTLVCHNIAGVVRLSIAPVLIFPWFTCHPAPLTGRIFIAADPKLTVLSIQELYPYFL